MFIELVVIWYVSLNNSNFSRNNSMTWRQSKEQFSLQPSKAEEWASDYLGNRNQSTIQRLSTEFHSECIVCGAELVRFSRAHVIVYWPIYSDAAKCWAGIVWSCHQHTRCRFPLRYLFCCRTINKIHVSFHYHTSDVAVWAVTRWLSCKCLCAFAALNVFISVYQLSPLTDEDLMAFVLSILCCASI